MAAQVSFGGMPGTVTEEQLEQVKEVAANQMHDLRESLGYEIVSLERTKDRRSGAEASSA